MPRFAHLITMMITAAAVGATTIAGEPEFTAYDAAAAWSSTNASIIRGQEAEPLLDWGDELTCGECGSFCCCDHKRSSRFHLTEFNIYPTFSYLRDRSATYGEFEFASQTDLGFLEMENRTIFNGRLAFNDQALRLACMQLCNGHAGAVAKMQFLASVKQTGCSSSGGEIPFAGTRPAPSF